jgi:adenine deaminase
VDLPRVLDGSARLHGVIQAALDDRRIVAGHGSPPLDVLDGWIAAGVMSSHSARIAEALTMLRKGVHLQLKTERTAELIAALLALPLRDWRNVGLAVDDRTAADLIDRGGIDHEVRDAIRLGVPVITLNGHDQQRVTGRCRSGTACSRPGQRCSSCRTSRRSWSTASSQGTAAEARQAHARCPGTRSIPAAIGAPVVRRGRSIRTSRHPTGAVRPRPAAAHFPAPDRHEVAPVRDGRVRVTSARHHRCAIIERYGKGMSIGVVLGDRHDQGAIAWTVNHDYHNLGVPAPLTNWPSP